EREDDARQPLELLVLDRLDLHGELDAAVAQLAAVDELGGEAGRRRHRAREQEVGDGALVRARLDDETAVPGHDVDAALELTLPLGLDVGIAGDAAVVDARLAVDRAEGERGELLRVERLVAGLAV